MAIIQTRRSISVRQATYDSASARAKERGISLASFVEELIARELALPLPSDAEGAAKRRENAQRVAGGSTMTPSERRESRGQRQAVSAPHPLRGRGQLKPTMPAIIDKRPDSRTRPAPAAADTPARPLSPTNPIF